MRAELDDVLAGDPAGRRAARAFTGPRRPIRHRSPSDCKPMGPRDQARARARRARAGWRSRGAAPADQAAVRPARRATRGAARRGCRRGSGARSGGVTRPRSRRRDGRRRSRDGRRLVGPARRRVRPARARDRARPLAAPRDHAGARRRRRRPRSCIASTSCRRRGSQGRRRSSGR